jgi:hypothetical protein
MRSGSSPALRQNHSTRRVLQSKSCTEQSQYHQSRTGRCTWHRCRRLWNLESESVLAQESESVSQESDRVQMTTEVRSQSSRFRECTSHTGFRGRRRRSHSHLRRRNTCLSRFVPLCQACGCAGCGCAARADDADDADGADGGCAMRNIDRTRRGKGSVHLSRASSTRWDMMCNSCKSNILRQSAPSRCICNRCRRLGCGCASRGSGCAMSTEFHNPRSLCRGCSCRKTRTRAHHRRNHHQRRSCRCLSIVPPCRSGGGGTEGLHV